MGKNTNTAAPESGAVVEKAQVQEENADVNAVDQNADLNAGVEENADVNAVDQNADLNAGVEENLGFEVQKEVRFLLSPTGRFGLSYYAGDVASFNAEQADEMIELGYAEEVEKTGRVEE